MPIASTGSIDIHYEVHGRGEPLLMIQGLGHSSRFWFLQLPVLHQHFRTIVYDCRGVGHSSKPEEPYTLDTLADDAADALAVLDALDIDRAHVVGLSRGGHIAQTLAIDYPQRVNNLALMTTQWWTRVPRGDLGTVARDPGNRRFEQGPDLSPGHQVHDHAQVLLFAP